MDISRIREDFPIFQNQIQPFVYMDNGATAQKPLAVVERLRNFYLYENSNIHRGSYPLSSHASNMYEKAYGIGLMRNMQMKSYLQKAAPKPLTWLPVRCLKHGSGPGTM